MQGALSEVAIQRSALLLVKLLPRYPRELIPVGDFQVHHLRVLVLKQKVSKLLHLHALPREDTGEDVYDGNSVSLSLLFMFLKCWLAVLSGCVCSVSILLVVREYTTV